MINFIRKTFLTFFLLGLLFSYSKAAEDLLPEVMVGQPNVLYAGNIITDLELCAIAELTHAPETSCTGYITADGLQHTTTAVRGDGNVNVGSIAMKWRGKYVSGHNPITKLTLYVGAEGGTGGSFYEKQVTGVDDAQWHWVPSPAVGDGNSDIGSFSVGLKAEYIANQPAIKTLNVGLQAEGSSIRWDLPTYADDTGAFGPDETYHQTAELKGDGNYDVGSAWIGLKISTGQASGTIYGGFSGSEVVYNHTNDGTNPVVGPGQIMGKSLGPSIVMNGTNSFISTYVNTADDTAKINDNAVLLGKGDFAVSVWFKRNGDTGTGADQRLVSEFSSPHYDDLLLQILGPTNSTVANRNKVAFRTYGPNDCDLNGPGTGIGEIYSTTDISTSDTRWHHVFVQRIITSEGSTHELWLDGVLEGRLVSSDPLKIVCLDNNLTFNRMLLGGLDPASGWSSTSNPPNYFKGSLDDARIYAQSFSGDDIVNLFHGNEINVSDLKAHWALGESSGLLMDSSGNNNNLTATGAIAYNNADGPMPYDTSQYDNYGYDLFGFDESSLANCINGIIIGPALSNCFISNSSMSNVTVMNSRTYINGQPATEMATLLYPSKPLIVGDAYLGALNPNDFAYWGKNLVQNKGTTYDASKNAYWGEGAYDNILANDVPKYLTKITAASADAVAIPIGSLPAPTMFLQGTNYMSSLDVDVESKKYPNGKIWSITNPGGSNIGSSRTYKGKGTLIVKNNICFGSNVNGCVQPITWQKNSADIDKNQMGIIVLGDVTIASGSTIEAAIFCTGKMIVGDNVTLKGSFVAQSFEFKVNGVSSTGSGTRFIYDNNLNKNIPPIFGELNMPHATE